MSDEKENGVDGIMSDLARSCRAIGDFLESDDAHDFARRVQARAAGLDPESMPSRYVEDPAPPAAEDAAPVVVIAKRCGFCRGHGYVLEYDEATTLTSKAVCPSCKGKKGAPTAPAGRLGP